MSDKIKIVDIQLSNFNPRYNQINPKDGPEKIKEENKNYQEIEIAKKLLSYEENNMSTFLELLESLADGYKKNIDKPLIIYSDKIPIVVEGNRRILALKLLNNNIDIKSLFNEKSKDYEKIKNIIDNKNEIKETLEEGDYEIVSDDSFWPAIYTRHNAESKGKKPWSRIKYFYDLLSFYDSLIDKKNGIKECSKRFNRPNSLIQSDIKSARFIKTLITEYNDNTIEKIDPFNDGSSKKGLRPSAFEPNNLVNIKIKDIPLLEYLGIEWGENNKILINNERKMTDANFEIKDVAKFLIDSYYKKMFNTRGWKENHRNALINFVNNFGLSEEKKNDNQTFDDLMNSEIENTDDYETDDDTENIENVYNEAAKNKKDKDNANSLIKSIKEMSIDANKIEFPNSNHHLEAIRLISKSLFELAKNSSELKLKSEFPFVSWAASIRAIWEHIFYYVIDTLKSKELEGVFKDTKKTKNKIDTQDSYVILGYIVNFINQKSNNKGLNEHETYENRINLIANLIKKSKNSSSESEELNKILLKSNKLLKIDGWWKPLNEIIHSLSKMIKDKKYNNAIKFMEIQIEILKHVIKFIVT